MVKRFRMIAGPNGSGKSTLVKRLRDDYSVNFYSFLYFIATENPKINACRVANRHAQGGHDVPSDKIVSRYSRSVAQLRDAIPYLSRAYVFDNSGSEMQFLGEYAKESGWIFAMPIEELPAWFVGAISE